MNIMIATAGFDSTLSAPGGTAEGALFVASFAALGLILLVLGGRLLRNYQEPHTARYSAPRL
jgi:hypothetical protein